MCFYRCGVYQLSICKNPRTRIKKSFLTVQKLCCQYFEKQHRIKKGPHLRPKFLYKILKCTSSSKLNYLNPRPEVLGQRRNPWLCTEGTITRCEVRGQGCRTPRWAVIHKYGATAERWLAGENQRTGRKNGLSDTSFTTNLTSCHSDLNPGLWGTKQESSLLRHGTYYIVLHII
jgi:hypothetical protein